MKTGFSTITGLNAGNREKQNELRKACLTHLLALSVTLLPMILIGCGGDTASESTSNPITARPNPTDQLTDDSVHETPVRTSVKSAPDSSSDSTDAPLSVPEDTASPVSETNGWKVLFRASDPNLWNTSSDDGSEFSLVLDDFADEIRWLRMRRMGTREAAIIPLASEDLLKVKKLDNGIFWNGTGQRVTSAGKTHRKLGIASQAFNRRYKSKGVLILNPPRVSGSGWSGWGFGKIALIHSPQYFAWAGELIPETVFEISVTNGDLSSDEEAQLVLPRYGLSAASKVAESSPDKADPPLPKSTTPAAVANSTTPPNDTSTDTKVRQPVPDDSARKAAATSVRKLFEQEFENATTQQEQSLLAGKLLEQFEIATDDAATRYELLTQSRELATNAGDAHTALAAVDAMAKLFDIDSQAEKLATLNRSASKAKLPIAQRKLAEATLPVIYEAVSAGDFDSATQLATVARTAARKGRALDLTAIFKAVSDDIRQLKDDSTAASVARKALEQKPDAPAEHLTIGVFLCLAKGNWEKGLGHLASAEDDLLKQIAELESAKPATPQAKVEVADLWMKWIKETRRKPFDRFKMAAEYWYRSALPGLVGAERTNAENRLQEIGVSTWTRATVNSNGPSVTLPDLSITSSQVSTPWTVIFRSSNPADWNPVNAPQNMRYLRVARFEARDYIIIELTIEDLRKITEGTIMWNGRNILHTGARRLGIASSQWYHGYTKGNQIVPKSDHKDGYGGWGFGRPCAVHGDQVFLWFDKRIPETVFEISVTPGPLHVSENRHVLLSRPIAVN